MKKKGSGEPGFLNCSHFTMAAHTVSPSQINNGEAGDLLKASCGLKTTGKFQIVSV